MHAAHKVDAVYMSFCDVTIQGLELPIGELDCVFL